MLVIDHRLATAIATIVNGEVVEYGSHQELIAKDGEYAKLYKLQFGSAKEKVAL